MDSTFSIIQVDGLFKIYENGKQLRLKAQSGKLLPVEFDTREAAEGFVRAQELFRAFDQFETDE